MFYLINKPSGFTSFDVIRKLRKITGIKKMGHTGTLDPLATGCLLIATDNSTKLISRLEMDTKTYLFTVDMGLTSPSLDLEGEVESVSILSMISHTNNDLVEFLGNQRMQLPPKYSAIHIGGKRAYDLIRKGKQFEIPERPICVTNVEIVEKTLPKITIRLTLSAGGYVRSFAPIIANFYGIVGGGCITSLHREKVGNIDLSAAMGFEDFNTERSIPYEDLLTNHHIYYLDIIYQKSLIDGLIVDVGTIKERSSGAEILVYCGNIYSLAHWVSGGIEVIRNYV